MPRTAVNANVPNPVPLMTEAGRLTAPQPGAVPPQTVPEMQGEMPEANGLPGRELVAKLDTLLLRAAKTATSSVSAEKLSDAADIAGLDALTRGDLRLVADRARASFLALAGFTGRQIGAAVELKDGRFSWKDGDPVATAIKKALDDQAELGEKLHNLVNSAGLPDTAFDALCELAFQCDRRGTEIMTLAMELADAVERSSVGENPNVDARLDRRLEEMLPRQALSMHGTTHDIGRLEAQLRPLVDRLDEFAARGPGAISAEELNAYTREIRETANALARAGSEGIPAGDDGSRIIPDRQLLDAAAEILRGLEKRLADIRTEVVKASAGRHVAVAFDGVRKLPLVNAPSDLESISEKAPATALAVQTVCSIIAAADEYVKTPTQALRDEVSAYLGLLTSLPYPGMGKEWKEVTGNQKFSGVTKEQWNALGNLLWRPKAFMSQVAHLISIMDSKEGPLPPEKFLTAASARALFDGELVFTTLVEARVRGMDDADVDPALDQSNLDKFDPLGSGNANTVYIAKFKDGSEHVFKPEVPGRMGMETLTLSMDYHSQTQVAHLNVASSKAAKHLGLEDVMVKTTVGSLNGQYGIFMERAPGNPCAEFTSSKTKFPKGFLGARDIRKKLPDEDYAKVVGRIMRQTNRLEWFDLLTGQGDRHNRNFMVQVKDDLTVTVKAIDNDQCFPAYRTGLKKMLLDKRRAKSFDDACSHIVNAYPEDLRGKVQEKIAADPGIRRLPDGRIELDPSKVELGDLHWAVRKVTGGDCDVMPEFMDEDFYNHLMELKPGTHAREMYRADLAAMLPADAVDSAMLRLDEAIETALRYKAEGKVISAADFEKREVQKRIVKPELEKLENPVKPIDGFDLSKEDTDIAKDIVRESRLQVRTDYAGDIHWAIARSGWFDA